MMELEHKSNMHIAKGGKLSLVLLKKIIPPVAYRTSSRPVQGTEDMKQCCLPHTRRSQDGQGLRFHNGEINPFQDRDLLFLGMEGLVEPLNFKKRTAHILCAYP
jgi:hypothetical protein